jgi:hypothetical protein
MLAALLVTSVFAASAGFFIVAVVAATLARRPWLAALLVAASGFAKETTPLFASAYLATAWAWSRWESRRADSSPDVWRVLPVVCAALAGAAAIFTVHNLVGGDADAAHQHGRMAPLAFVKASFQIVAAPTTVYAFLYMLPLGPPRLHPLPREWLLGSLVMACLAVVGGAYADIGANVFRPLVSTIGPCLAMAGAFTLKDLARSVDSPADA